MHSRLTISRTLIYCLLLLTVMKLQSQTSVSLHEAVEFIEEMNLIILNPVESRLEILTPEKEEIEWSRCQFKMRYKDTEILALLLPSTYMIQRLPHLEFSGLLNHLAVNDEEEHIFVYTITGDPHLDWESEARFVPKSQWSRKKYALMRGFFKEDQGLVILIYLSDRLQVDVEPLLAFRPVSGMK
ncbi:MAG TPA: hypothetical protein PKC30_13290 [Saprospiraceae bacterium]|nr:hypothetical protein [Saprospiraceae bacterium]